MVLGGFAKYRISVQRTLKGSLSHNYTPTEVLHSWHNRTMNSPSLECCIQNNLNEAVPPLPAVALVAPFRPAKYRVHFPHCVSCSFISILLFGLYRKNLEGVS